MKKILILLLTVFAMSSCVEITMEEKQKLINDSIRKADSVALCQQDSIVEHKDTCDGKH